MRPLLPHLYLVDFCAWVIVGVVVLASPLPLLTSVPVTTNIIFPTVMIASTAVGCLLIVLLRGQSARALCRQVSSQEDQWGLAFDEAQLQDSAGTPLRDFQNGALSMDSAGALALWTQKATPDVVYAPNMIVDAETSHRFPPFCYPTLSIELQSSLHLVVRPLKSKGPSWRIGMTRREVDSVVAHMPSRDGTGTVNKESE